MPLQVWPAVQLLNFTVVPVELRISTIAAVSFGWLMYMSFASRRVLDHRYDPQAQEVQQQQRRE